LIVQPKIPALKSSHSATPKPDLLQKQKSHPLVQVAEGPADNLRLPGKATS
jgi:hypothetical protein